MSVYEKYLNGEYDQTCKYPTKPREPAILNLGAKQLAAQGLSGLDVRAAQREYDSALAQYEADKKEYNTAEAGRLARFQHDLEIEHGMSGHPKAELVWSYAWEHGHSSGLGEVATVYADIVEIAL